MTTECPHCGSVYAIDSASQFGMNVECSACGKVFVAKRNGSFDVGKPQADAQKELAGSVDVDMAKKKAEFELEKEKFTAARRASMPTWFHIIVFVLLSILCFHVCRISGYFSDMAEAARPMRRY